MYYYGLWPRHSKVQNVLYWFGITIAYFQSNWPPTLCSETLKYNCVYEWSYACGPRRTTPESESSTNSAYGSAFKFSSKDIMSVCRRQRSRPTLLMRRYE